MRVTHIAPTLFGEDGLYGGGERYPLELARALATRVSCRLVGFGPRPGRFVDPTGLEIVVLRAIARLKDHPAHPVATGLAGAISDSEVIHTHHMRSFPSRISAVLGTARRQRRVVTDHGLGGGGWWGVLPNLFDAFLGVSEYSINTLGVPRSKARVIYGGADTKRFRPSRDITRSGVLFVGRLTPHKGIDTLLDALPTGVHLTLIGTAGHDKRWPERAYPLRLHTLAGGKDVSFLPHVDDADLADHYRRAQVFVLPSVHHTCYRTFVAISELLSLSALEAMASGTPVICSRIGGLPEIVREGETGFLVEPGNATVLRARIEELTHDPELAARMGRAGRALVSEKFTWDHCAERCLQAYAELRDGAPA